MKRLSERLGIVLPPELAAPLKAHPGSPLQRAKSKKHAAEFKATFDPKKIIAARTRARAAWRAALTTEERDAHRAKLSAGQVRRHAAKAHATAQITSPPATSSAAKPSSSASKV